MYVHYYSDEPYPVGTVCLVVYMSPDLPQPFFHVRDVVTVGARNKLSERFGLVQEITDPAPHVRPRDGKRPGCPVRWMIPLEPPLELGGTFTVSDFSIEQC